MSNLFVVLSLAALALEGVYATPIARSGSTSSLPFKALLHGDGVRNAVGGALRLIDADRARIKTLKTDGQNLMKDGSLHKRASFSFGITNAAVGYMASIGVGNPPTQYSLIIDTGSSNTWIGAGTAYQQTSTGSSTGNAVTVNYGYGSFSGTEYIDMVTLSSQLVVKAQSIGVASTSNGFAGTDGVLGLGPDYLTHGTVASTPNVPTVTDNLFTQHTIGVDSVGVYFAPSNQLSTTNGELTFGGVDSTKISGSVAYVPLTTTKPSSYYWGVNQAITYNGASIMPSTAGVIDAGTTLVYIPTDAYNRYATATGGVTDSSTGTLAISAAQYAALKPLTFTMNGKSYSLSANAQIWPRALNNYLGGVSTNIYLVTCDIGSISGTGLDFITGYAFLERFYSVFDTTNSRIGFATTAHTNDVIN